MLPLLVIQIIIVISLVIIVLIQNPSADSLAGLNSNVKNDNVMTSYGKKNSFLAKLTYVIAALFIINNLCIMAIQSKKQSLHHKIIEQVIQEGEVPIND
ncbi:MAG: preprotein translocase subunit SecG [Rickettsiaceae bacterium H1]|nr:preprotein translocase subunit SecG [Rickettsiaceae bacterium H1]